jgi:DMSO/TMAO reductase YedYZ heme-binding membrane subunit
MVIFGIASVAAGVLDLIWGEFESAHQPIQAWGDHIPGITILAYIAAFWLIAAGAAITVRRTAQAGAAALAILYAIFAVFPLPRLYTAPQFFGYRATVYIGVLV